MVYVLDSTGADLRIGRGFGDDVVYGGLRLQALDQAPAAAGNGKEMTPAKKIALLVMPRPTGGGWRWVRGVGAPGEVVLTFTCAGEHHLLPTEPLALP